MLATVAVGWIGRWFVYVCVRVCVGQAAGFTHLPSTDRYFSTVESHPVYVYAVVKPLLHNLAIPSKIQRFTHFLTKSLAFRRHWNVVAGIDRMPSDEWSELLRLAASDPTT